MGVRVVAEGPGGALRLPHGRGLRGVAGHGVAGAGAVLGGHLAVLHDLLDLGPFVLEPDFHLEEEKKAGQKSRKGRDRPERRPRNEASPPPRKTHDDLRRLCGGAH